MLSLLLLLEICSSGGSVIGSDPGEGLYHSNLFTADAVDAFSWIWSGHRIRSDMLAIIVYVLWAAVQRGSDTHQDTSESPELEVHTWTEGRRWLHHGAYRIQTCSESDPMPPVQQKVFPALPTHTCFTSVYNTRRSAMVGSLLSGGERGSQQRGCHSSAARDSSRVETSMCVKQQVSAKPEVGWKICCAST